MSKAFRAAFQRLVQRLRPRPVGSRLLIARYRHFRAASGGGRGQHAPAEPLFTEPAAGPAAGAEAEAATENAAIPTLQDNITRARQAVTTATAARKDIPAKLPASDIDPDARVALLRTGRRGLQMV